MFQELSLARCCIKLVATEELVRCACFMELSCRLVHRHTTSWAPRICCWPAMLPRQTTSACIQA
jgi:hypothetical protein